jgi:hypothetical protein
MANTEIQGGEYVRTKDGYIRKVTRYNLSYEPPFQNHKRTEKNILLKNF